MGPLVCESKLLDIRSLLVDAVEGAEEEEREANGSKLSEVGSEAGVDWNAAKSSCCADAVQRNRRMF